MHCMGGVGPKQVRWKVELDDDWNSQQTSPNFGSSFSLAELLVLLLFRNFSQFDGALVVLVVFSLSAPLMNRTVFVFYNFSPKFSADISLLQK